MTDPAQSFEGHLARGDLSAAADCLVRVHGRDVLHLCAAIVRDRGAAEDLAQDVFSKAFTALPEFRGEASARTWLMTIARHRCVDHLRRSARQPWTLGHEEDLREPTHATHDEQLVSDLLVRHADLRAGLAALNEGERAMVLLRFAQGLSFDEIADTFGVKAGAVRMRVGRALTKMREAIEREAPVAGAGVGSPGLFARHRGGSAGAVSLPASASASAPAPARAPAPAPAPAAPPAPSRAAGRGPHDEFARSSAGFSAGFAGAGGADMTRAGASSMVGETFVQGALGALLRELDRQDRRAEDAQAEEAFLARLLGLVPGR